MLKMQLNNIDIEDIEMVLFNIEKSFKIEFSKSELEKVNYFGDLCDIILEKIKIENIEDCTKQQAFYKLRNSIEKFTKLEKEDIKPETTLNNIFPEKNRRNQIKKFENDLGFQLNILTPKKSEMDTFGCILSTSLILFFFSWKIALIGIFISIIGYIIIHLKANTFSVKTIKELTAKTVKYNYSNSRRNQNTVNKKEIKKLIIEMFSEDLFLEKSKLKRDTKLILRDL